MEHKFYRTGSDMSLQDSKFSANVMRNKKNIFYEEDPSKKCRNYPNPDFFSYKECDSKYTRKDRHHFPGMDLMPPWLDEDLANVTSTPLKISSEESPLELNRVFYGIETSD